MTNPTCTMPACEKPSRGKSAALCPMHYHRAYRHGDVNKVAHGSDVTASHGRRYKMSTAKGHQLSNKAGRAYTHRLVLWEAIGPGWHACHHCSRPISWDYGKGHPETLQVDHLNNYGDDNRLENLAPSCGECNSTRGSQNRADALRAAGWWSVNDTIDALKSHGRRARIEPHQAA
jgi:5-methylcytosine-specific restriction endonuclease McrA